MGTTVGSTLKLMASCWCCDENQWREDQVQRQWQVLGPAQGWEVRHHGWEGHFLMEAGQSWARPEECHPQRHLDRAQPADNGTVWAQI